MSIRTLDISVIGFSRKILTMIILMCLILGSPCVCSDTYSPGSALINGLTNPYPAPSIVGIKEWINSSPLNLDQLKGKVVLINFWTFACINCIHTLPILAKLDETYRDKGLVIIGVHAPELPFERNPDNIKAAVKEHNINYAVALDNDFKTWSNYHNHSWPALYLIDRLGRVVYVHFGEGDYEITESNINYLLTLTP